MKTLGVLRFYCTHIPTHQNCSFCPEQRSAWAGEDVLRCVPGGTGAETMGPSSLGLTGHSCSTCSQMQHCICLGRRLKQHVTAKSESTELRGRSADFHLILLITHTDYDRTKIQYKVFTRVSPSRSSIIDLHPPLQGLWGRLFPTCCHVLLLTYCANRFSAPTWRKNKLD